MSVERPRALFIGTGGFGVPTLERLAASDHISLVGIVTAPARPAGRAQAAMPSPVEAASARLGLAEPLRPARLRDPAAIEAVLDLRPALIVLADYGRIVPPELLGLRFGALNLHPSLLPRHRGASPIAATIVVGDRETGVTLIRMDDGVDTGPIVAVQRVSLDGDEDAPGLEDRLAAIAGDLLDSTLPDWIAGRLEPRPQDEAGATMTRPLRRADGRLDPDRPAAALERQVRAYRPWPGSFIDTPLGRLIVHRGAVGPGETAEPGRIVAHGNGLALVTTDGTLVLEVAQLEGRRPMDAPALRRGAPGLVGAVVR
ncbi:MAG: methionyl-tRNA formyltransferase [Chloroflexota bacterium]